MSDSIKPQAGASSTAPTGSAPTYKTRAASDDPPCCEACGMEYALREGYDVSRFCDPCAQNELISLTSVVKEAVKLISKSEITGWCKYATAARELLETALRQSPNAPRSATGAEQPTGEKS